MYDDVGWGSSFLLSLYEVKALVVRKVGCDCAKRWVRLCEKRGVIV